MYRAAPDRFGGIPRHDRGAWLAAIPEQTEAVELTGSFLTRMVTFEDVADPASMIMISSEDFAASFGDGVRLVSVELAVTDTPPDVGRVESVLPWLEAVGRERSSVLPAPDGLVSLQPDPHR